MNKHLLTWATLMLLWSGFSMAQGVLINEGSNKNYTSIPDEDQEYSDWIELYNASGSTVNLLNYSLTDDPANPTKWTFPNITMQAGEYKVVFCSGKDRKPISGFIEVQNATNYNPTVGWNTHNFTTPFYWDGVSNVLINTCAYSSTGYTLNSVFNQSTTPYFSTIVAYQDGSDAICDVGYGTKVAQRPNVRLNGVTIGTGTVQNGTTTYPAPYGNWYWASKNQMLIRGSELIAAGLTAGNLTSLAFDVVSTPAATIYDYVDIHMKLVSDTELTSTFHNVNPNNYQHTNFSISSAGETVYLYNASQVLVNSLQINCSGLDNSNGLLPDASTNAALFGVATPAASNNGSNTYAGYLQAPTFSVPSGMYSNVVSVEMTNINGANTEIRYTTDGSDPTATSTIYNGLPVTVFYSGVLKARVFSTNNSMLPSPTKVASYLLGINHVTPVLSVVTDDSNLHGSTGIFDNWQFDWQKAAYVEYFDTAQQLIFSQNAAIQIDGGAGGSRSQPQHSFRVELSNPVLGDGSIHYPLIPNRPNRTKYSGFYLRNGSNQYLEYPYKDAAQVEMMVGETNGYYSAWRPISVYVNGAYFGLYELREKFDTDYFKALDDANADSVEILSQSYWYGGTLRAVMGSLDSFYNSYNAFNSLSTADTGFWNKADKYFDMTYYNDYIIAESWMGNVDWPWNNIKIYRSDKTNYRWRFCVIDLELSMMPNGWTDCYNDHIAYMLGQDPNIPYINIWLKGMQNAKFKNYFINRFADVMNTAYQLPRLLAIENSFFNQTALEMVNEYMRWGDPNNIPSQMNDFNDNHLTMQFQLSERTTQVRNHIESNFALAGQVDVTLDVSPAGAGKIKISTIVPDSLPWTGVYFNGNPVVLTAIANPGYQFDHWDANNTLTTSDPNASILVNIAADDLFNAVFVVNPLSGELSISEVNYHSDSTRQAGDWIEFHNYGASALDVSGWRFSDGGAFNNYTFPNGSSIQAGQRVVLVEDSTKFRTQHSTVPIFGQTGFGFSNSNETLTLYDLANTAQLSMHYFDTIPWQPAADGFGYTLELLNDTLDPNLPSSWFAGCIGGSPTLPYTPCTETVSFSEINYNSATTADAGDWVELINTSTTPKDVSGWKFRDSDDTHTFTIPAGTVIPPSGFLVLVADDTKFSARFPNVTNKVAPFVFGLSSSGEAIRLFDLTGRLYQSMVYDNKAPFPLGAAGNGYTLQIINQAGLLCDGANWQDGCLEGSPGTAFIQPCTNTSVEDVANTLQVKLFPNPNTGKFTLVLEGLEDIVTPLDLTVLNVLGEVVYLRSFNNQNSPLDIDISNVPDGIYFVKMEQGNQRFTKKIIVQHN